MKMNKFNKEEFYEFIFSNDIVGLYSEPVRLKSGRLSPWYVNLRNVTNDAYLLNRLTDFLIDFVEDLDINPDCFYGVPESATKIAIILQYKWARKQPDFVKGRYPMPMGRGKPKNHGLPEDRYFVGIPKGGTVIVEDVTTTGSSLLKTIHNLRAINANVIGVLSLTNREEFTPIKGVDDEKAVREFSRLYTEVTGDSYEHATTIEKIMNKLGIKYYALSTASELLREACSKFNPNAKILYHLKEYLRKYSEINYRNFEVEKLR